jgi:hypothetical protein
MLTRLRLFVGGGAIFMQSNSELLFRQLRNQPDDLTLLSMCCDACEEEEADPHLLSAVRFLLHLQKEYNGRTSGGRKLDRWSILPQTLDRYRWMLGITPVQIGSLITFYEGRAFPISVSIQADATAVVLCVEDGYVKGKPLTNPSLPDLWAYNAKLVEQLR